MIKSGERDKSGETEESNEPGKFGEPDESNEPDKSSAPDEFSSDNFGILIPILLESIFFAVILGSSLRRVVRN